MRMDIRCSFKGVLMPEVENYRRRAIPFSAIPFCEPHSAKNECSLNECPLIVYSKRSLVGCCKHLLVAHCKRLFEVIVCENYIKIHRNLHRLFFYFLSLSPKYSNREYGALPQCKHTDREAHRSMRIMLTE